MGQVLITGTVGTRAQLLIQLGIVYLLVQMGQVLITGTVGTRAQLLIQLGNSLFVGTERD